MDKKGYFNYIFIGAGASATLLLRSLESRGLLANKKIALIDADNKTINDKTYCFWTSMDDTIAKDCQYLFSQSWSKISVNRQEPEVLDNSRYVHISSIALYDECRRIVNAYRLSRIYSSVLSLLKTDLGVEVQTVDGNFHADLVFDSRPPMFAKPEKNEAILWQTFIGQIISPIEPYKQLDRVDLMDFDIPQLGFTQFMYVLPLSNNRILVEMTRFGADPITSNQADPILAEYIQQRFGTHTIVESEKGIIPMSTSKIITENIEGVIPIGGRSGAIKPSTGYAFKKMYQSAEQIAQEIKSKKQISIMMSEPKRFEFYDRLLLMILLHHPNLGKSIFSVLFKKNHVFSVFRFLEGKTTIFQDIRILLTLPCRPFLRVLRIEVSVSLKRLIAPFSILCLAVTLLLIQTYFASYSVYVQLILFSAGFLAVGLPHGALDHLLESGVDVNGMKISFIMKYLGVSFIFLLLWMLSADCALLFFLAYSIWHFGQCDFQEWIPERSNTKKNILWGTILFGILLIGHQEETNRILSALHTFKFPFTNEKAVLITQMLFVFSFVWSILERKASFILTVCMLYVGCQLPLLSAFSLYFIGQHSLNGWRHLKIGLKTNNQTLYLKSLPFNLGAIGIFVVTYWLSINYFQFISPVEMTSIFFVFLSCISFPHIIWMNKFYRKTIC